MVSRLGPGGDSMQPFTMPSEACAVLRVFNCRPAGAGGPVARGGSTTDVHHFTASLGRVSAEQAENINITLATMPRKHRVRFCVGRTRIRSMLILETRGQALRLTTTYGLSTIY